jgi:hypothetical protein
MLFRVHFSIAVWRFVFFSSFAAPCPAFGPFCLDLSDLPGSVCTLCALHNGQRQHHGILELTWTYRDSRFDLNT